LRQLRKVEFVNVDKIVLKFGLEIYGGTVIPDVTKGIAKSHLKATVEINARIGTP